MKPSSQDYKSVCIVLRAAQRELEHTSNYVERIVALRNTADILKMLTDYTNLGEQIEHSLRMPDNVSNQKILAYTVKLKTLLAEQIVTMEAAIHH
ncbi:MAG: hypothetical protein AMJ53_00595 [Gammaproteobacteria bacterium SG8_11]|nr:MAG: hypothetical protein AMJ53_00595 [Gammaproteobacteria bacterium SG8_11]